MSKLYRDVRRAVLFILGGIVLVVAAGGGVWLAADLLGIHVSPILVIGALGAAVAWIVVSSGNGRPPAPPPGPPPAHRVLSRAEVEALLILHREGRINTSQLNRALGGIIPPEVDDLPPMPRGGRR